MTDKMMQQRQTGEEISLLTMSSTKPEVHNVSQRCQSRTKSRP